MKLKTKKSCVQDSHWSLPLGMALCISSLFSLLTGCTDSSKAHPQVTIGISQIVEHGALDQERKGILEVLNKAGFQEGKNLKLVYRNAQGNTVTASQIAQTLISQSPDVLVGISTPSAQSLLAASRRAIPVVFSAVSDPQSARLTDQDGNPTLGATGVTDRLSAESQLDFLASVLPQLKILGVLYNPGEPNSVKSVEDLREVAEKNKLSIVTAFAQKTSDVPQSVLSLVGKVDAIYIPNDNTVVSSIESVIRIAQKNTVPVFAGDIGSVEKGAIGMAGYDRLELGKKAGKLVLAILSGKSVRDLPVESNHPTRITINTQAAKQFGITIPQSVLQRATLIGNSSDSKGEEQ